MVLSIFVHGVKGSDSRFPCWFGVGIARTRAKNGSDSDASEGEADI